MKYKELIAIAIIIILLFSLVCIKAILSGLELVRGTDIVGFGIDTNDNIYIGHKKHIDVYIDGKLNNTIKQNKDYVFYVQEDLIIIGTKYDKAVEELDLYGNFLKHSNLDYDDVKEMAKQKTRCINDSIYTFHNKWGVLPYELQKDGQVIFSMTSIDYIFSGIIYKLLIFSFIYALAIIGISVYTKNGLRRNVF